MAEVAWNTEDSLSPDAFSHRPRMKRVGHFLGGKVSHVNVEGSFMNRSEPIQTGNLWDSPVPTPQCQVG